MPALDEAVKQANADHAKELALRDNEIRLLKKQLGKLRAGKEIAEVEDSGLPISPKSRICRAVRAFQVKHFGNEGHIQTYLLENDWKRHNRDLHIWWRVAGQYMSQATALMVQYNADTSGFQDCGREAVLPNNAADIQNALPAATVAPQPTKEDKAATWLNMIQNQYAPFPDSLKGLSIEICDMNDPFQRRGDFIVHKIGYHDFLGRENRDGIFFSVDDGSNFDRELEYALRLREVRK